MRSAGVRRPSALALPRVYSFAPLIELLYWQELLEAAGMPRPSYVETSRMPGACVVECELAGETMAIGRGANFKVRVAASWPF